MGAWGYMGMARTDCRERERNVRGWAGIIAYMGVRWRCMDPVITIAGKRLGRDGVHGGHKQASGARGWVGTVGRHEWGCVVCQE